MDGFAGELLAQSSIHQLMLLHPYEVAKTLRDNSHLEVVPTSGEVFDLHLRIRQGPLLYL